MNKCKFSKRNGNNVIKPNGNDKIKNYKIGDEEIFQLVYQQFGTLQKKDQLIYTGLVEVIHAEIQWAKNTRKNKIIKYTVSVGKYQINCQVYNWSQKEKSLKIRQKTLLKT